MQNHSCSYIVQPIAEKDQQLRVDYTPVADFCRPFSLKPANSEIEALHQSVFRRKCWLVFGYLPQATPPTAEAGMLNPGAFADKWDKKYEYISRSWQENWEYLS
ncbi:MAG: hypothetical protein LBJ19_00370 [Holosporaceae bacterium]|jgi:hypothetical protein|nr:hypothetical protein [Holosporaceae bacterium]